MILMLRSPAGEAMSMEQNLSEQVITGGVLRQLSEEELAEYRRPFANRGEDRHPPLSWARENPVHGEPSSFIAKPACQILVIWTILSPSNCIT